MATIPFTKGHGLGNDFVLVRAEDLPTPLDGAAARRICDRHFGLGADGVLVWEGGDAAPFMRVFNADGSEPQMCGNGLRVFARWVASVASDGASPRTIGTPAGPRAVRFRQDADGVVDAVTVDMGPAIIDRAALPMRGDGPAEDAVIQLDVGGRPMPLAGTAVSMGNPHFVIFGGEGHASRHFAERYGPRVEAHPDFPEGVNVEFVETQGEAALTVVVWERGCGVTLACGTGACAAAAAAAQKGWVPYDADVTVTLPGGPLQVRVAPEGAAVAMTGPAELIADGAFDAALLAG